MENASTESIAIRKARISSLVELILKANKSSQIVSKRKFVATMCYQWGICRRTLLEYLVMLEDAGQIFIVKDNIVAYGFESLLDSIPTEAKKELKTDPPIDSFPKHEGVM